MRISPYICLLISFSLHASDFVKSEAHTPHYKLNTDKLIGKEAVKPAAQSDLSNFDLKSYYATAVAENTARASAKDQAEREPENEDCARFAKGTWRVNAMGGFCEAINGRQSVYFGGVAAEYFIVKDLSLRGELVGYSIDQHDFENCLGGGFNALARWYALKSKNDRMALFLEGGGGLAEFDGRTPGPKGTDFNFTLHAGFGGDFKISKKFSLLVAPRYLHVSNAFIHGKDRHGTIDSLGGYVGFSAKF